MDYLDKLLEIQPFESNTNEGKKIFQKAMFTVFDHHINNCLSFKKWCLNFNIKNSKNLENLESIPFYPNMIFKKLDLVSSKKKYKTILSSGTQNQNKSRIFLDSKNSKRQRVVLSKILNQILEKKRLPFLITDLNPSIVKNDNEITARVAGMTGYLLASSSKKYILEKDKQNNIILNINKFKKLIDCYREQNQPIVIIGYTYMIYEKLILPILENNIKINFPKNSFLIHFGGWKKLENKKIDKKILTKYINENLNIKLNKIIDIYGFTEQLGTVYPAFGLGNNKVPIYSKIFIRDMKTLKVVEDGKEGFIQFLSPIQTSYPGISILNDDIGRITKNINGEVEFEILKRIDKFEQRGCGDTLPDSYYI